MSSQSDTLMSIVGMTPEEPTNIVYSTKDCPKCHQLKIWLTRHGILYISKDVSEIDAATRTDMILEKGYFPLMVPILKAGNLWLYTEEMFDGDRLNESRLEVACQK